MTFNNDKDKKHQNKGESSILWLFLTIHRLAVSCQAFSMEMSFDVLCFCASTKIEHSAFGIIYEMCVMCILDYIEYLSKRCIPSYKMSKQLDKLQTSLPFYRKPNKYETFESMVGLSSTR